jgi:hypothetical protein
MDDEKIDERLRELGLKRVTSDGWRTMQPRPPDAENPLNAIRRKRGKPEIVFPVSDEDDRMVVHTSSTDPDDKLGVRPVIFSRRTGKIVGGAA